METKLYCEDTFVIEEGNQYEISFKAWADAWYYPGCMYLSNGDPGYPPDEGLEVTKIKLTEVIKYDDKANPIPDYKPTKDEEEILKDKIAEMLEQTGPETWIDLSPNSFNDDDEIDYGDCNGKML